MKKLYKYFCAMHPQYDRVPPDEKNRHLAIIGGSHCHFQGLKYRPHLLCQGADEAIVANIHQYYQNPSNAKSNRLNIIPDYKGIRVQRLTLDSEVLKLQRQLEDARAATPANSAPIQTVRRRLTRKTRPA